MKPIGLAGFEDRFAADADPWRTFSLRDEAVKRRAILHALGSGPLGRTLELASGNGSNSVALAPRTLRLDATEGTESGTRLTADALAHAGRETRRARALTLRLPARFMRSRYDAIVVAELLYYLTPSAMAAVARETARTLRRGGRLVLAHHRVDFHDFTQHAAHIHSRFLRATGGRWRIVAETRTRRWRVVGLKRG